MAWPAGQGDCLSCRCHKLGYSQYGDGIDGVSCLLKSRTAINVLNPTRQSCVRQQKRIKFGWSQHLRLEATRSSNPSMQGCRGSVQRLRPETVLTKSRSVGRKRRMTQSLKNLHIKPVSNPRIPTTTTRTPFRSKAVKRATLKPVKRSAGTQGMSSAHGF